MLVMEPTQAARAPVRRHPLRVMCKVTAVDGCSFACSYILEYAELWETVRSSFHTSAQGAASRVAAGMEPRIGAQVREGLFGAVRLRACRTVIREGRCHAEKGRVEP